MGNLNDLQHLVGVGHHNIHGLRVRFFPTSRGGHEVRVLSVHVVHERQLFDRIGCVRGRGTDNADFYRLGEGWKLSAWVAISSTRHHEWTDRVAHDKGHGARRVDCAFVTI